MKWMKKEDANPIGSRKNDFCSLDNERKRKKKEETYVEGDCMKKVQVVKNDFLTR